VDLTQYDGMVFEYRANGKVEFNLYDYSCGWSYVNAINDVNENIPASGWEGGYMAGVNGNPDADNWTRIEIPWYELSQGTQSLTAGQKDNNPNQLDLNCIRGLKFLMRPEYIVDGSVEDFVWIHVRNFDFFTY
jgi:hypothetical protein